MNETEIRRALDAKAHEVDVPVDLARRTIEAAQSAQPSLRERLRARLDAWRLRAPVTGYPRWMYAGAAVAAAVLLFGVGNVVTKPELRQQTAETRALPATGGEPALAEDEAQALRSGGGGGQGDVAGTTKVAPMGPGGSADLQLAPEPPVVPSRPGQFPPKIVRTAELEVQVRNFERAWAAANALASRHGGFVTSSSTEQSGDELDRGNITLRIPATKLDAALGDLRELGKVTRESSTGQDVSAQIVDIDARRRVLEAEELQLVDLLRRASGVSQILEVRDRLNGVRQEIESLAAQKKVLDEQVEYSTVNATIFEKGAEPADDDNGGVIPEAWRTAVRVGLTVVAGTLVVLGGLIPLVALGAGVWAAVRLARRRRA